MALRVKNITFGYIPEENVLTDINLEISSNDTLAIVGASGCGKSTLLRLIAGILPKNDSQEYSGEISFNGQAILDIVQQGQLSFMFQEATLMPNLSVQANVALPLKILNKMDNLQTEKLIGIVGLSNYRDYLPKHLSGGMKTRVALARSFITKPQLLLLDEPFSALDIAWKSKLYEELEKLRESNNTTVVMVTHDVQEALLLANKIVVLNLNGEIKAKYSIQSEYAIGDRVKNISKFMNEVYEVYAIPIQEDLMSENINVN